MQKKKFKNNFFKINNKYFYIFFEENLKNEIKSSYDKNTEIILNIYNNTFSLNDNLNEFFFNKFFGLKKKFVVLSEIRTESLKIFNLNSYSIIIWFTFVNFYKSLSVINDNFQNKYLNNIIFLYLIRSYRGWRHIFSLPTAGQRTKSNSSTPKKNTILKNEMFNIFKDGLKSFHPSEVRNSFLLEQLNLYWLENWKGEWNIACKKRNNLIQKNNKKIKFEVNTLIKLNPNFSSSKKQNIISIGFEPGFTKYYLQEIKSKQNSGNIEQ